VGVKLGLSR